MTKTAKIWSIRIYSVRRRQQIFRCDNVNGDAQLKTQGFRVERSCPLSKHFKGHKSSAVYFTVCLATKKRSVKRP